MNSLRDRTRKNIQLEHGCSIEFQIDKYILPFTVNHHKYFLFFGLPPLQARTYIIMPRAKTFKVPFHQYLEATRHRMHVEILSAANARMYSSNLILVVLSDGSCFTARRHSAGKHYHQGVGVGNDERYISLRALEVGPLSIRVSCASAAQIEWFACAGLLIGWRGRPRPIGRWSGVESWFVEGVAMVKVKSKY